MGFSRYDVLNPAGLVYSGAERAQLVRRTYTLVLADRKSTRLNSSHT